jgi:hypothetical protein
MDSVPLAVAYCRDQLTKRQAVGLVGEHGQDRQAVGFAQATSKFSERVAIYKTRFLSLHRSVDAVRLHYEYFGRPGEAQSLARVAPLEVRGEVGPAEAMAIAIQPDP